MKAVVFRGDRKLEVVDIPRPEPGRDEVLVQIKASGLCGSDMYPFRTPAAELSEAAKNLVRGHEPCGVVAALGPGARGVKEGDRVMVHHYGGCRECKYCRSGWTQLCERPGRKGYGLNSNGGHEEFVVVPDYTCIQMPDGLSFEEGASCSCGTGTAFQALRRIQPSGMDTFAIYGQGPVGVAMVLLSKAMGARVVTVDTKAERLALGKRFGADETVDASKVDPVQAIKDLTGGEGADCAVDCTGVGVAQVNMLKSVRIWGRGCFVGEHGTATIDISPVIIKKHLTIYGSWTFSTQGLADVANFVVKHKLPLRETITHTFPLEKAAEAYELFDSGTTGKIALIP